MWLSMAFAFPTAEGENADGTIVASGRGEEEAEGNDRKVFVEDGGAVGGKENMREAGKAVDEGGGGATEEDGGGAAALEKTEEVTTKGETESA